MTEKVTKKAPQKKAPAKKPIAKPQVDQTVEVNKSEAEAILQMCSIALKCDNNLGLTQNVLHFQNKFTTFFA